MAPQDNLYGCAARGRRLREQAKSEKAERDPTLNGKDDENNNDEDDDKDKDDEDDEDEDNDEDEDDDEDDDENDDEDEDEDDDEDEEEGKFSTHIKSSRSLLTPFLELV
ncbi:hypothetical protein C8R48DRAFT_780468 [Suillus tomentosus]|nr:hypothetical protein C8R48DRAFT_780468 [Suillus tomentosus]